MSARTEQLLIEISELEKKIAAAEASMALVFKKQLLAKQRELSTASEALTEGKQVLKG